MKVLDKGYVKYIEHYGSDESIIEAARMSTDKGFLGWDAGPCPVCEGDGRDPDHEGAGWKLGCKSCDGTGHIAGDAKLLKYLWTKKHATPFEMAGMILEVKAPIMVFREWMRHRSQSFNEMSARYVPLPDENYMPSVERLLSGSKAAANTKNRQAQGSGKELSESDAMFWLDELERLYNHAQRVYDLGLELGVPKELARLPVPVGRYSKMRVAANLRNWLAFETLRISHNAQYEIRIYAQAILQLLEERFPRTIQLFREGAYE